MEAADALLGATASMMATVELAPADHLAVSRGGQVADLPDMRVQRKASCR